MKALSLVNHECTGKQKDILPGYMTATRVTLGPVALTSEAWPPALKIPAQESSLWKAEKQNLVNMATLGREASKEVSGQFWASNMKLRFKPGARDLHCW